MAKSLFLPASTLEDDAAQANQHDQEAKNRSYRQSIDEAIQSGTIYGHMACSGSLRKAGYCGCLRVSKPQCTFS